MSEQTMGCQSVFDIQGTYVASEMAIFKTGEGCQWIADLRERKPLGTQGVRFSGVGTLVKGRRELLSNVSIEGVFSEKTNSGWLAVA